MFNRILRLLATGLNAYSFYSNPLRFFVTLICILLIPYLTYVLWGSLFILILAAVGLYFIYKAIRNSFKNKTSYY